MIPEATGQFHQGLVSHSSSQPGTKAARQNESRPNFRYRILVMAAMVAGDHNAIYFNCGWAINQTQFRDAQLQYSCIIS